MDVSEVKVLARRANGILFVAPVFILLSGFALVYSILVLNEAIEPDKDTLWWIYMFTFLYRYKISGFRHAWDYRYAYNFQISEELASETRFGHINDLDIFSMSSFDLLLWECIISYSIYLLVFLGVFLQRLLTPRTIMEYDDHGLYIYRTGKPVTLLRYEELWSSYSEEDFENVELCYHRGFYRCRNIKVSNPFWGTIKTGSIRIEIPGGFINLGGIYHVKEVERELKIMIRKNRKAFLNEMYENMEEERRQRDIEELAKHNPET